MTILDHLMSLLCVCVCVFFYEVHLQRVTAYKIESIFQLKFLPYSIWPWFLDKSSSHRQEADWGGQESGVGDRELALNVDRGSVLKDEKYFQMR